jgi:hypothetical protein
LLLVLQNKLLKQIQDVVVMDTAVVKSLQPSDERYSSTKGRHRSIRTRQTWRTTVPLFQQRSKACCPGSGYSRKQRTEQTTGGHEEGRGRGFYSPEGFPFPVTR